MLGQDQVGDTIGASVRSPVPGPVRILKLKIAEGTDSVTASARNEGLTARPAALGHGNAKRRRGVARGRRAGGSGTGKNRSDTARSGECETHEPRQTDPAATPGASGVTGPQGEASGAKEPGADVAFAKPEICEAVEKRGVS
jgi:hypothetical protein